MKRRHWVAAVTLVLLAAAGVWRYTSPRDDAPPATLATVTRGTLEDVVTAQGKLEAKQYVDVGAQVSGQLKKLYYSIGDQVKQGALVAELDPRLYKTRVEGDIARIASLKAQLDEQAAQHRLATQQIERTQRLIKVGAATADVLDQNRATLDAIEARQQALQAQIREQQATLEGDRTNLGYTRIYAPMDGTVVVQDVREGQTLNAIQITPVIMRIANLDVMTVRAQIAEADVSRLHESMDVEFSTLGALNRKWHGKLRQLLPTPEVINDVVLFNALVDVDNTGHVLMTGMSTQLFFVIDRAENALLIPRSAVHKKTPGSNDDHHWQIQVMVNGVPTDKTIVTGLMTRTQVEVREGLNEGDSVIDKKTTKGPGYKPMMGPRI